MIEPMTVLAAASTSTGFNPTTLLLPLLLIGGLYFLMIRPQRRQQQQQRQLVESLDVGDEVMTTSGMIGTIVEMDDDIVVLEIAEGVEVHFIRAAVSRKYVYDDQDEDDQAYDEDDDQDEGHGEDDQAAAGDASPNGQSDDSHKGPWFEGKADGAAADATEETKGSGADT